MMQVGSGPGLAAGQGSCVLRHGVALRDERCQYCVARSLGEDPTPVTAAGRALCAVQVGVAASRVITDRGQDDWFGLGRWCRQRRAILDDDAGAWSELDDGAW